MTRPNRLETLLDAAVATMFALLAVSFSGLCDPWLAAICGGGSAIRLAKYGFRLRCFTFLIIASVSFLESRPWFLNESFIAFGASGFAMSWILERFPAISLMKKSQRILEILPAILVISFMPLLSSILSEKSPKRGIIDGGVWAKANQLPIGQEALSMEHQYGYEKFKEFLGAEILSAGEPLEEFDELFLVTPTVPLEDSFVDAILDWTSNGGRLLVVADHTNLFGHQTVLKKLVEKFGVSIQPDAIFETETNGGVYKNPLIELSGLTPCSVSRGLVPRLKMEGWSEYPDYTASSFFGEISPSNDDHWGHHVVMGSRRHGLGEITVFTDSTFFANFAINRWASNVVASSLFWSLSSTAIAILGLFGTLFYIKWAAPWLLFLGMLLVILCPSIGFDSDSEEPRPVSVRLKPPSSVLNDSEERDRGFGSSLLASAYAFDVGIRWDRTAERTFMDHINAHGLSLQRSPDAGESEGSDKLPSFDVQAILDGEFYVDENSFWYSQGVGPVRAANMACFWRSIGATIPDSIGELTIQGRSEEAMRGTDGMINTRSVCVLQDNWVIFDNRMVGRWVPESEKWLIRKEWQLSSFLDQDQIYEPVP